MMLDDDRLSKRGIASNCCSLESLVQSVQVLGKSGAKAADDVWTQDKLERGHFEPVWLSPSRNSAAAISLRLSPWMRCGCKRGMLCSRVHSQGS